MFLFLDDARDLGLELFCVTEDDFVLLILLPLTLWGYSSAPGTRPLYGFEKQTFRSFVI